MPVRRHLTPVANRDNVTPLPAIALASLQTPPSKAPVDVTFDDGAISTLRNQTPSPSSPAYSTPSPAHSTRRFSPTGSIWSVSSTDTPLPESKLTPPPPVIVEPVLNPDNARPTVFPIKAPNLWALYKKHLACFWTVEEINLADDMPHLLAMPDSHRHFLLHVLAFFAISDKVVADNLTQNFMNEVTLIEAQCFYSFQTMIEYIHNETYSLFVDTYVPDKKQKDDLFNAIETMPAVAAKAKWAELWCNPNHASFAERLVAFTVIEGIFFSGSFCAVFWFKQQGILPGFCFANELISRDEALHCEFGCELYRQLLKPPCPNRVREIVDSAVQIEVRFITSALPDRLLGMNAPLMTQYIKFVADRLLHELRVPKMYNVTNPFPWMEMISLQGKTNFFEKRVGEYAKSGVGDDSQHHVFSLDAPF